MKKLFSLLTLALLTMSAWAQNNVTFDFTSGYDNAEVVTTVSQSDVTITFDKGTGSNAPAWYSAGAAIRVYAKGTITVDAPQGYVVKGVTFTFGSGDNDNAITSNVGTFEEPTWTGEAAEVVFTVGGTSKHRRIAGMVVTIDEAPAMPIPVFTPNGGTFDVASLAVTVSSEVENASIYLYKVVDGEIDYSTQQYFFESGEFYVTETSTYAAYAYKGSDYSDFAYATFTKVLPTVANPTFNPASGATFDDELDVVISCATPGATISYFVNDDPFEDVAPVTVTLTETATITAWASLEGYNESQTVTASYTKLEPVTPTGNTFALVTDVNDLAANDQIIIVNSNEAGDAYAMGGYRNNNFYGKPVIVASDLTVTTDQANIITLEANGPSTWNLKTVDGYLYASSSQKNYMNLETTPDGNGNANAAITIGDLTNIIFQGTNTRNEVRFNPNNGDPIFSCYGSTSSMAHVYIYKATNEIPPVVTVAAPIFNPAGKSFKGSIEITMTSATEGADIYYTLNDGEEMLYEGPITLTETTTVKAYAELDGEESTMTTAYYTRMAEVATIAEANALSQNAKFAFTGNAVVVYQCLPNTWLMDETGFALMYGGEVPEMAEGTTLNPNWDAQYHLFREHIHEYQYPNDVTASDAALVTITATEYTAVDTTNINERVIIKNLTLTAGDDAMYLYTADGMPIYNQFGITYPTLEEGKTYDVEGMVSYYGGKVQIMPIAITEHQVTPAGLRGDVNDDQVVDINDVTRLIDVVLGKEVEYNANNSDCQYPEPNGNIDINDVTALIGRVLNGVWANN